MRKTACPCSLCTKIKNNVFVGFASFSATARWPVHALCIMTLQLAVSTQFMLSTVLQRGGKLHAPGFLPVWTPVLNWREQGAAAYAPCFLLSLRRPCLSGLDISNPARGCGLDRANPDWGTQRRGLDAARSSQSPRAWIAVPTCPCNLHCWLIWMFRGSSGAHQETKRIYSRGFSSFSILSG